MTAVVSIALGEVFPPRTPMEIEHYPQIDVMQGFTGYEPDEPLPGPNRPPGFRWGWQNRHRDRQCDDDGFDHLRHALIRLRRAHHGHVGPILQHGEVRVQDLFPDDEK